MNRKLNILFMSEYFGDTVCINNLYNLEQAIGKISSSRWAGPGHKLYVKDEPLSRTVKRVMRRADWVFYYDFGVTKRGLRLQIPPKNKKRQYNVMAYIADLQREPYQYRKYLNECGYDVLLMTYLKTGKQITSRGHKRGRRQLKNLSPRHYTAGLKMPYLHIPPSIDVQQFKPVEAQKKYDVTFIGALNDEVYPLRKDIWGQLPELAEKQKWSALIKQGPPGRSLDRKISQLKDEHIVGQKYAEALALSKVFIFGTSVFKYPLFKFVEGMASKTCVMSDTPLTAKELHFIPDWNFVHINRDNWKEKLIYYLEHDDELEQIAQRGYETVMKYHTTDIRAKQVVDFLGRIK